MGSLCITPGSRTTWITVVLKHGKDKGSSVSKHTTHPKFESMTATGNLWILKKCCLRLTFDVQPNYVPAP